MVPGVDELHAAFLGRVDLELDDGLAVGGLDLLQLPFLLFLVEVEVVVAVTHPAVREAEQGHIHRPGLGLVLDLHLEPGDDLAVLVGDLRIQDAAVRRHLEIDGVLTFLQLERDAHRVEVLVLGLHPVLGGPDEFVHIDAVALDVPALGFLGRIAGLILPTLLDDGDLAGVREGELHQLSGLGIGDLSGNRGVVVLLVVEDEPVAGGGQNDQ